MDSDDNFGSMFENATVAFNETSFGRNNTSESIGKISLNFVDSFVKAFSVMIVSELGDKTFFLAGQKNSFKCNQWQ